MDGSKHPAAGLVEPVPARRPGTERIAAEHPEGAALADASPSPWLVRWAHLIPPAPVVLAVAGGSGRPARWLARHGHRVVAVARDAAAVAALAGSAETHVADLERDPWPFARRRFDAIVVTNYLWRPLLPTLVAGLAEAGVRIYETFASGTETGGRPRNPDHLLGRGELLGAAAGLQVVAFEDGFLAAPDRFVQRIVAVRASSASASVVRYALSTPRPPPGQLKSGDSEDLA
jgi:SAM-dependent methyltransferase